jgi:hypothetical protein
MLWRNLLRWLVLAILVSILMLAGFITACTPVRHLLVTADPSPSGPSPKPNLFASLPSQDDERLDAWEARRLELLDALDEIYYGAPPQSASVRRVGEDRSFGSGSQPGDRRLRTLEITADGGKPQRLTLAIITPSSDTSMRGVFLLPYECGLRSALRDPSLPPPAGFTPGYCNADGMLADLIGPMFGEWVGGPPVDWLLERGYAIAAWHESDIAPDSAALHDAALERLGLDPAAYDRPGTVSLWAWTISRVADAISADPEFADLPLVTMGHSRRGKAVLLAAARDRRIDVAIAHQAGTAGGALHGDGVGEPVASITQSYPHWFVPGYAGYAADEASIPVDQHALIALVAPRALLLGNAWRDSWADPSGAWRAMQAADPAWTLYGAQGLLQTRMADIKLSGTLAMHIRPGTHGVTSEDWLAFLAFADAHTANTVQATQP